MTDTPITHISLPISATIEPRTAYGQHGRGKRKVWDAKIGQVEATGDTKPEAARGLAKDLRALAMNPTIPVYRQHKDGRGAIIRIHGADLVGVLQVTIDLLKPEGTPTGAHLFALEKRDSVPGSRTITLESNKWDVEWALKHELEHYLRSIGGM